MSNSSLAVHSGSKTRQSTRVNRAIQLAVEGVDSFRGPYHEEVNTITVNAHGCMYESNHEVLSNAFVVLQLNGKDSKPVSRARPREMDPAAGSDRRPPPDRDRTRLTRKYLGHRFAAGRLVAVLRPSQR